VHKKVPSPRPPKQEPSDIYSNATRLCLLTLIQTDNGLHGGWTEMPICALVTYFINIFARNNDVTVCVTCHGLVKVLERTTTTSLFHQTDYAVILNRNFILNVFSPGSPLTPASPRVDYILHSRTTIFYFLKACIILVLSSILTVKLVLYRILQ
jgi:hypothetical protein